jgi:hypothetical protein
MSEILTIDSVAITELMKNPTIVRIVTILDITSLSLLELFEYGLRLKDVNAAMVNGIIHYEKPMKPSRTEEITALGIPITGDYYYSFLNSKVKLTDLGLHILDSLKGNQLLGSKSPGMAAGEFWMIVHVMPLQSPRCIMVL